MLTGYRALGCALLPAMLLFSASAASAEGTKAPEGPIEITVPSSAGSTPDVLMRQVGKIMNDEGIVTNPFVVVNRPGGAWTVGINWVLNKPADANNVLSMAEPVISTPIVQGGETVYDKLTPLGIFVQTQLIVIAQPDHKANNLAELVAMAKANPEGIKVSGANSGSTDAQVAGLIEKAAGIDLTYVPHDGGGAAQATFLGGNTDILTATIDEALPLIEAGKAKPLAILNEERRPEDRLKNIPTAKEQGIDVVWGQVFGIIGAPNLDPAVVAWWDEKIGAMVKTAAWKKVVEESFLGSTYYNSAESKEYLVNMHNGRLEILRAIGAAKL